MARHLLSQPMVRSTTHRRGLCPFARSHGLFSSPIDRMCGTYFAFATSARAFGVSNPLSRQRFWGTVFGFGRSTTTASITPPISVLSCAFAGAIIAPSGPPSSSTRSIRFVPGFARSVGFLPVKSPQNAPCS